MDTRFFDIQRFVNISNLKGDTLITGTSDADSIYNYYASNVTINAGAGNDTVDNYGASNVSIDGGDGNDSIDNRGSNVTIKAGDGNDTIFNSGANVTINAGKGDDSIDNYYDVSDTSIVAGTGNDTIWNSGANVTIDGGEGNDFISSSSYGKNVSINGGDGNDSIGSFGKNVTINAGDGDDSIDNTRYGSDTSIIAGAGNDTITNSGVNVSINGGDGNDYISNLNSNVTIDGGAGNDTVYNSGSATFIIGGAGNDSIYRYSGKNITINAGEGDDTISLNSYGGGTAIIQYSKGDGNDYITGFNSSDTLIVTGAGYSTIPYANNVLVRVGDETITLAGTTSQTLNIEGTLLSGSFINNTNSNKQVTGTAYNDTIFNSASTVTIDGGRYDDFILNSAANVTIYGGAENDTINNSGENVKIYGGDGEDSINNSASTVTIDGGAGKDTIQIGDSSNTVGSNVTAYGGAGDDSIANYFSNSRIYGNDGNDSIYNSVSNVTIDAGAGNDSIRSYGSNVTINAGTGDDYINNGNSNVTINAGSGNDTIYSQGSTVKVEGGAGNDYISVPSSSWSSYDAITIAGGTGDDTIYGNSYKADVYQYSDGDGNDAIYNLNTSDTILVAASAFATLPLSNNNILLQVGNGITTLYGASGKNITIEKTVSNVINGTEGNDTINNTLNGAMIYGYGGNDSITNSASNVTINAGTGNDTIKNQNTSSGNVYEYNSGDGNDLITGFTLSDTLIIAGTTYSTVKSGNNLIVTAGNGAVTLQNAATLSSFNIEGTLAVDTDTTSGGSSTIPSGDSDTTSGGSDTIPAGVIINNKLLTVSKDFTEDTLDLNRTWANDITKVNLTAVSKNLTIVGKDTSTSIKSGKGADTISGGLSNDTIYGGSGNDVIDGGEGNDLLKGDAGVDTIDGGTGKNTLTGGAGKDVFIHSEGEDVITDYVAGQDKIVLNTITGDSLKGSDIILFTENGNVTVKGGKNKKITIVDGEGNSTTQIYGQYNYSESNTKLALTSGFSGTLNADDYDSAVEEINATAITKSGRINGNGNNNIIVGSARNDSINGNGESNTLTGGNGNDVFIHEKGDDYITDYTAGKDKVKLLGVTITSASIDENDLILQTTEGTITIAEGKGKKITVVDAKNKTTTAEYPLFLEGLMYDKKNVVLTATTDFTGETIDLTDYYSTTTRVNANAVKTAIEIYGNDSNNSIKGGKGSDTIYGGKGNDTLTGGTGKDIFVYEKGDDVITDYKAGQDKIKFEGSSITGSTIKSSNVILQTNEGTLTIKSGRNKKITVIDSSGNETTQVYGNSSALLEDNLFVEDVTIDEITEIETGVNLKFNEGNIYEQPELVIVETDDKTNLMK